MWEILHGVQYEPAESDIAEPGAVHLALKELT